MKFSKKATQNLKKVCQNRREIFSNFAAFSQCFNFNFTFVFNSRNCQKYIHILRVLQGWVGGSEMAIFPYFIYRKCPYEGMKVVQKKAPKHPSVIVKGQQISKQNCRAVTCCEVFQVGNLKYCNYLYNYNYFQGPFKGQQFSKQKLSSRNFFQKRMDEFVFLS